MLHDLVVGIHGQVDGQREANAFKVAAAADDHGIDADHFAVDIEQRASAIAAVDGRVGLQEALHLMAGLVEVAALGADDAGGHGLIQSEGRADGHRPIADFDGVGVADVERGELLAGVDLQNGQVELGICADQLSRIFGSVAGQGHLYAGGVLDHVVVGENVAVAVHDEARAEALGAPRLLRHVRHHVAERVHIAERILAVEWLSVKEEARVAALFLYGADDLYDGRLGFLSELGERVG